MVCPARVVRGRFSSAQAASPKETGASNKSIGSDKTTLRGGVARDQIPRLSSEPKALATFWKMLFARTVD